jgi:hypothetical protein
VTSKEYADNTFFENIKEGKPKYKHNKHRKPSNSSIVLEWNLDRRTKRLKKEMGVK